MKKLHLFIYSILLLLGGITATEAQAKIVYDFTDWENKTYSSTTTVNGLTLAAASGKEVTIENYDKDVTIDGITFPKRLKFGGSGSSSTRNVSFKIPGNGTLTVYGMSANSSATRILNIAIGSFNNVVTSLEKDGTSVGKAEYSYKGGETTVYLYSANSGFNIHGIVFLPEGETGEETQGDVTIIQPTAGTNAVDISDHAVSKDLSANQMEVLLTTGDIKYYNTKNLSGVNIDKKAATVAMLNGDGQQDIYYGTVKHIGFAKKVDSGQEAETINNGIAITEAKGWYESCYAEWTPIDSAKSYNVYIKGGNYSDYTKIDGQLVRNYGSYGRADMVGLVSGTYSMKVVGVDADKKEMAASGEAINMEVVNYKREGFAFLNRTAGVGAYNNDGSLKSGARVLYVTAATAKTIICKVITNEKGATTECTGIQTILDAYQKGYDSTPTAFRLIGTIKLSDLDHISSKEEGLQIKSNKDNELNITIEGIGEDATIKDFGILAHAARSLELRNFAIMNFMDDAVSVDNDNKNVWIHHLDIFYGQPGSDSDQAKGDGTVDVKTNSQYITVSYNHFWDSGKSSLCGMKSESGPNYISYDHNWFDHSDSRHPRVRTMTVHVWNNYYDGISKYGVGATFGSSVFVENNYFRNCKFPMLSSLQGNDVYAGTSQYKADNNTFSGESGGSIKSFGNVITGAQSSYWPYQATEMLTKGSMKSASSLGIDTNVHFDAYEAKSRNEAVPATVKSVAGGNTYNNFDTNSSLMYDYTPDAAADIPAKVAGFYGAGRLNHGDFNWTFDSSEDTNDKIIDDLKTAILNYKSTLVGIFGDVNGQGTEGGDNQGGDNPGGDDPTQGTTISSDIECTFTVKGGPSNSAFTVVGSYSNSKGTATINGTTYTECLKLETSTSVTFTIDKPMTLTLVFGSQDTKYTIKINGTKATGSNGILTTDLDAGTYKLTKADTGNLFYIGLKVK